MSKKRKLRAGRKKAVLLLVLAAALAGVYLGMQGEKTQESYTEAQTYKEETVRRGSVSTGVTESGTITFGTVDQTFEVAEVTEVDASSDTSSDSSAGTSAQASSAAGGVQQSVAGASGASAVDPMASTGRSGGTEQSASGSSSSSGEETTLEVEEVYAAPGQQLNAGDKILKITDESIADYRQQLEASAASAELLVAQEEINAETKRAEADYTYQMYLAEGETAEETYQATITSLEEAVADIEEEIEDEDDEDELEQLEAELKIAQNNLTTGTIEAKQAYENARTNYEYADQLYEIDTDGLEDDLDEARETLAQCQENLEAFEEQIGDGIVYAAQAGTVSEVAYAQGDMLINESPVVTCTDPADVSMTVSVSQEDISSVSVGDAATVYLTAYGEEAFEAEITGISTSTAAGSSTVGYEVTAALTGDCTKVYNGMTGEVSVAAKTEADALYISNRAVHLDGTRSWVKVKEEDGTVREADVTTGFSNGKTVVILSGLEEGQTVLIESQVTQ